MSTDFRALCVELTDCLEKADWPHKQKHVFEQWIYIARKALAEPEPEGKARRVYINNPVQIAECGGPCMEGGPEACDCGTLWRDQPEPEGPTDEELESVARAAETQNMKEQGGLTASDANGVAAQLQRQRLAGLRAVLARWGTPNSAETGRSLGEPVDGEVAELATAEMMRQLRTKAATEKANRCHYSSTLLTRAAELLERLSPPQPVPVSERLPGPELCWWYEPDEDDDGSGYGGSWTLLRIRGNTVSYTHWLPAHALPLPGEVEG